MSANTNQPRQAKGVPTGGQWRATARPEGRVALADAAVVAARRRATWEKLDAEQYYTDQLDDPGRYEVGTDGKPDVLGSEPRRYVLIEEARHNGRFWVGTFETRAEAARYRDTTEASDDWYVLRLVDLDTGRQFHAEQTTRFLPDVGGAGQD